LETEKEELIQENSLLILKNIELKQKKLEEESAP
tara:strand:+ start:527 stop:628 length:102 start_codon:yes stop_codon:yes gene_type:complete